MMEILIKIFVYIDLTARTISFFKFWRNCVLLYLGFLEGLSVTRVYAIRLILHR
jgi:hypothetical protein